jgi:hypothetical protein
MRKPAEENRQRIYMVASRPCKAPAILFIKPIHKEYEVDLDVVSDYR